MTGTTMKQVADKMLAAQAKATTQAHICYFLDEVGPERVAWLMFKHNDKQYTLLGYYDPVWKYFVYIDQQPWPEELAHQRDGSRESWKWDEAHQPTHFIELARP